MGSLGVFVRYVAGRSSCVVCSVLCVVCAIFNVLCVMCHGLCVTC